MLYSTGAIANICNNCKWTMIFKNSHTLCFTPETWNTVHQLYLNGKNFLKKEKSDEEYNIYLTSKCLSTKFIIKKGKRVTIQMWSPADATGVKCAEWTPLARGQVRVPRGLGRCQWEYPMVGVWFSCQRPEQSHGETWIKPRWRNMSQSSCPAIFKRESWGKSEELFHTERNRTIWMQRS